MPVDVQVKDNGNGTYTCTYTPRKPVKHTVMVSWGGVNIPESPFRVSTATHTFRDSWVFLAFTYRTFLSQRKSLYLYLLSLTTDDYRSRLSSK